MDRLGSCKVPVHLEIRLKDDCEVPRHELRQPMLSYLETRCPIFRHGDISLSVGPLSPQPTLSSANSSSMMEGADAQSSDCRLNILSYVCRLKVADIGHPQSGMHVEPQPTSLPFWRADIYLHFYKMALSSSCGESDGVHYTLDDQQAVPAFTSFVCPNQTLDGLWESIHVEGFVKEHLLAYAQSAILLFGIKRVDSNLVNGNKIALLHGAPGVGKTSLARGLAQKLSVRLSDQFSAVELLEINSNALLSKYFGESASQVLKCFDHIRGRVEEDSSTLFVLVLDEVESLASSRSAAISRGSSEPTDAVRVSDRLAKALRCSIHPLVSLPLSIFVGTKVVNAMLQEIDRLRNLANVLLVCTSNITGAIDSAFLDRSDLILQLGLPNLTARYEVMRSGLMELMRVGVISPPAHIPARVEDVVCPASPSLCLSQTTTAAAVSSCGVCVVGGVGGSGASLTGTAVLGGGAPAAVPQSHGDTQAHAHARTVEYCSGLQLLQLAQAADGLSGRALRKLPLQAHALNAVGHVFVCDLRDFMAAMGRAIQAMQEVVGVLQKQQAGQ